MGDDIRTYTITYPNTVIAPEEVKMFGAQRQLNQAIAEEGRRLNETPIRIKPDDIKNSNVVRLLHAVMGIYKLERCIRFGRL